MSNLHDRPDGRQPVVTHNRGSRVIRVRGVVDRTRRPRRPNVPRFWPADVPFPKKPEPPPQPDKA